jgi:hypothetical protein
MYFHAPLNAACEQVPTVQAFRYLGAFTNATVYADARG